MLSEARKKMSEVIAKDVQIELEKAEKSHHKVLDIYSQKTIKL